LVLSQLGCTACGMDASWQHLERLCLSQAPEVVMLTGMNVSDKLRPKQLLCIQCAAEPVPVAWRQCLAVLAAAATPADSAVQSASLSVWELRSTPRGCCCACLLVLSQLAQYSVLPGCVWRLPAARHLAWLPVRGP
jgi:hypothetical protein